MRHGLLCRVRATFGLMGTGDQTMGGMSGFLECGSGLRMPVLTGAIRTTTITTMAGRCMRATGTMRIMATTTMTITATKGKRNQVQKGQAARGAA